MISVEQARNENSESRYILTNQNWQEKATLETMSNEHEASILWKAWPISSVHLDKIKRLNKRPGSSVWR